MNPLEAASYARVFERAEGRTFRLDEVLPEGRSFDFERSFLPESLAGSASLVFLAPHERRALNHVRAHGYLSLFGLVEGFILPFVLDQLRTGPHGGDARTRALLQFANEEAKHMALFERFQSVFERGFGQRCGLVGPEDAVVRQVLGHEPP